MGQTSSGNIVWHVRHGMVTDACEFFIEKVCITKIESAFWIDCEISIAESFTKIFFRMSFKLMDDNGEIICVHGDHEAIPVAPSKVSHSTCEVHLKPSSQ